MCLSDLWAIGIPQENSRAGSEIGQRTMQAHFFIQMTQFSLLQSAVLIIPFEKGKGKKKNQTEKQMHSSILRNKLKGDALSRY